MTTRSNPLCAALPILLAGLWLSAAPVEAQEDAGSCPVCEAGAHLKERYQLRESSSPVRERADWAPPVRVVTLGGTGFANLFSALVPNAEVIGVGDTTEVAAVIAGADVYIGLCTPGIIEAGQDIKYIHIVRAGADSCTGLPEVAERGILVTNMQRLLGPQVADHAMALTLSLARRLSLFAVSQPTGSFEMGISVVARLGVWELEGKTMLIVGLGGIGTEIAKRANAFGMRVHATRNSSREGPDFVEYVGLADEVLELAAKADVVVNATPLTAATKGMFNAQFFAAMKETAYFVNVGRGQSAVTADLVAALNAGAIAGAGLDVVDPEPLPPGHPLWSMPNVVLTPHLGGVSDYNRTKFGMLAAENLRRYAAGEKVLSVVNVRRGY